MLNDEMTICQCVEYLDTLVGDDKNIKDCLDYIERKAKSIDEKLREYKSIFEEHHPFDGNSFNFLGFKHYSNSTLKRMTKDELIDHVNIIYINWKNTDNTCERVSSLAKQLYEKAELYKTALELYISWADVYGFGYRQVTNEYPEYQGDIEEMDWPDNLMYVAIQKAKEKLNRERSGNV